jgi:hypothetical protein
LYKVQITVYEGSPLQQLLTQKAETPDRVLPDHPILSIDMDRINDPDTIPEIKINQAAAAWFYQAVFPLASGTVARIGANPAANTETFTIAFKTLTDSDLSFLKPLTAPIRTTASTVPNIKVFDNEDLIASYTNGTQTAAQGPDRRSPYDRHLARRTAALRR